tara:strand:+ start:47 stop:154 length:108 start_codon:yes stop_codon:yes gene_type:complete
VDQQREMVVEPAVVAVVVLDYQIQQEVQEQFLHLQ